MFILHRLKILVLSSRFAMCSGGYTPTVLVSLILKTKQNLFKDMLSVARIENDLERRHSLNQIFD